MKRLLASAIVLLTSVSLCAQCEDNPMKQDTPVYKPLAVVEVVAVIDTIRCWRICGAYCTRSASQQHVWHAWDNPPPYSLLKVYPNPSQRGVAFNVVLVEKGQITLYDLSGRIMIAHPGNLGVNRVVIPISYSAGTYLLRQGSKVSKVIAR
jgi:hypothetical protein